MGVKDYPDRGSRLTTGLQGGAVVKAAAGRCNARSVSPADARRARLDPCGGLIVAARARPVCDR